MINPDEFHPGQFSVPFCCGDEIPDCCFACVYLLYEATDACLCDSQFSYFCGYAWPCFNGGNATHWAYQVLKAHVVITIGAITDRAMAHIRLDARFEADQAVAEIVRQVQRLG